jgi:hypothetical protein
MVWWPPPLWSSTARAARTTHEARTSRVWRHPGMDMWRWDPRYICAPAYLHGGPLSGFKPHLCDWVVLSCLAAGRQDQALQQQDDDAGTIQVS